MKRTAEPLFPHPPIWSTSAVFFRVQPLTGNLPFRELAFLYAARVIPMVGAFGKDCSSEGPYRKLHGIAGKPAPK